MSRNMDLLHDCIKLQDSLNALRNMAEQNPIYKAEWHENIARLTLEAMENLFIVWLRDQDICDIWSDGTVLDPELTAKASVYVIEKDLLWMEDYKQDYHTLMQYEIVADGYSDMSREELLNMALAFDRLEKLFMDSYKLHSHNLKEDEKEHILGSAFSLTELIEQIDDDREVTYEEVYHNMHLNQKPRADESSNIQSSLEDLKQDVGQVKQDVGQIKDQLKNLTEDLESAQEQVTEQLKLITDWEEEEKVIAEFSDQCVAKVTEIVSRDFERKVYDDKKNNLRRSMGERAWNKLEEQSMTFLVTAKVMFNELAPLGNIVDYSGVCLPVAKAMEVELKKRFYYKFIDYLKAKYKTDYSYYPTSLVYTNKNKRKSLLRDEKYTLGKVAYTLCYKKDGDASPEKIENNERQLLDYCKSKLLPDIKSDESIKKLLEKYAKQIEKVRNDYRNPSTHTGELTKMKAEECFDFVLDSEKILKNMLDTFAF